MSVICAVPALPRDEALRPHFCLSAEGAGVLGADLAMSDEASSDDGVMGSTCTMCSHDCTMALISDVLPTPLSPATSTLRRPMRLPSSVKGRRLGILMLGMMSCGALPLSIMEEPLAAAGSRGSCSSWSSSSSSTATSPSFMLGGQLGGKLARSSERQSELRRDETLLRAEAGPDAPSSIGVRGCERLGVSVPRTNGEMGRERSSSTCRGHGPLELEGRAVDSRFRSKSRWEGTRGLASSGVSAGAGGPVRWSLDRWWVAGGGVWDDEAMADSSARQYAIWGAAGSLKVDGPWGSEVRGRPLWASSPGRGRIAGDEMDLNHQARLSKTNDVGSIFRPSRCTACRVLEMESG